MSLIVTFVDLNVDGGAVNCRCSRLHETKQKHRQRRRFPQRRKGAKKNGKKALKKAALGIPRRTLRLCAFAGTFSFLSFLNTAASFLLIDARHPVLVKNAIDLFTTVLQHLLNLILQLLIAAADAHRDVEDKRQERLIELRRDSNNFQRNARLLREVSGEWTPDNRHVNVALGNC